MSKGLASQGHGAPCSGKPTCATRQVTGFQARRLTGSRTAAVLGRPGTTKEPQRHTTGVALPASCRASANSRADQSKDSALPRRRSSRDPLLNIQGYSSPSQPYQLPAGETTKLSEDFASRILPRNFRFWAEICPFDFLFGRKHTPAALSCQAGSASCVAAK